MSLPEDTKSVTMHALHGSQSHKSPLPLPRPQLLPLFLPLLPLSLSLSLSPPLSLSPVVQRVQGGVSLRANASPARLSLPSLSLPPSVSPSLFVVYCFLFVYIICQSINAYIYIYIYIHMNRKLNMYIYIYIHTYIYIYIYMFSPLSLPPSLPLSPLPPLISPRPQLLPSEGPICRPSGGGPAAGAAALVRGQRALARAPSRPWGWGSSL